MSTLREQVIAKLQENGFTKETLKDLSFREKVEKLYNAGFTKEEIVVATGKIGNTVKLAIADIGKEKKIRNTVKEEVVEISADTLAENFVKDNFTKSVENLVALGYNNSSIAKALGEDRNRVSRVRRNKELADNALV